MKLEELKTGKKLELEVFDDNDERIIPTFTSQFEAVKDNKIAIIDAPIFEGLVFPVHIGWYVNVYFIQDENLFKFRAKVIGRENIRNMSYLKIVVLSEINKVQRRKFFRMPCALNVKYRVLDKIEENDDTKPPMKSTYTENISGGGICIKLDEEIQVNSLVECELQLDDKSKISFIGKAVRFDSREENDRYKYEMGILFRKISDKDKELIIRYIFEEQRKLRRKGLI